MSSPDKIAKAIEAYIASDQFAGAVSLVWRDGKVLQAGAVGWRDREALDPMARDTIFRIASMSKPVTALAAMTLLEEGRFALDDPISTWASEFADMRVLRSPAGLLDETDPAAREITFDDLLTHRSGLTYSEMTGGPIDGAYRAALGLDIDSEQSPDAWIAGLAGLPLIDQPGAGFHYGHSSDLLGLLIARMEGISLGEVLKQRIFDPLGMKDTGFIVPPKERDRRAVMYGFDEAGGIVARSALAGAVMAERPEHLTYESGGQGLWSTADDYLAFARLFVGEGAVDGVRLLKPETLALMTANRLTEDQRARAENFGLPLFTAHGFGLGLAVVMDPEKAAVTRCKGGVGTVGWPGAFGGWWQADPTDGSVMVFLAHNRFELEQLSKGVGLGVYGAITEFHGLASAMPR
jgi:CubicO group peptidase (beta-lactamase class C family)